MQYPTTLYPTITAAEFLGRHMLLLAHRPSANQNDQLSVKGAILVFSRLPLITSYYSTIDDETRSSD